MDWKAIVKEGVVAGSIASVCSSLAMWVAGRRETGTGAAAMNTVSHWLWDAESLRTSRTDFKHTAIGYATHHGASVFWATVHAAAAHGRPAVARPEAAVAGAVLTSVLAYVVDYHVVPKRLTPGFEHRISKGAMLGVYAALAVGLAAGAYVAREHDLKRLQQEAD